MKIEKTDLEGVFIIHNFFAEDERGTFVKTFNSNDFNNNDLNFSIKESYFSVSKKNVIRGMHFQLPPHDHEKLVFVPYGSILDVIVDLRKNSSTYCKYISIELSAKNKKSIFIPRGLAHGFKSLEEDTLTVYNVSSVYNSTSDHGIRFDSFGFDWDLQNPILSKRDLQFESLEDFKYPFE
jgi:dTDP-4-dehydrorhamnose 3,5-epimerase/CDP-3, 6-dideoxy-D-glycero-D-glycero-4-hexulose-5-epimerase